MATGLATRVKRLEDSGGGGGGECPRCSGVLVVSICGEPDSASKDGKDMSKEEYREFVAEEDEDGRCPVCGGKGIQITVGWPDAVPPAL